MKRKFILNPRAGSGLRPQAIARIADFFVRHTGSFDCTVTESIDQAIRATREALHSGADELVAIGGDGTVNAVVNGFFEGDRAIRPDACLAIADAGTGSDYFRTLSEASPIRDWKELVLEHAVRPVDVGRVRFGPGDAETRWFVNMASAGLSAEVVRRKNRYPRWAPRRLRYLLPTLSGVLSYRAASVAAEIGGQRYEGEILAICVCKGRYAGGGIPFGGRVALDDGLFDVTLILGMNPIARLFKLRKLYTGAFKDGPESRTWKTSSLTVRAADPLPLELDGDECLATEIGVSISHRALPLCVPASTLESRL